MNYLATFIKILLSKRKIACVFGKCFSAIKRSTFEFYLSWDILPANFMGHTLGHGVRVAVLQKKSYSYANFCGNPLQFSLNTRVKGLRLKWRTDRGLFFIHYHSQWVFPRNGNLTWNRKLHGKGKCWRSDSCDGQKCLKLYLRFS